MIKLKFHFVISTICCALIVIGLSFCKNQVTNSEEMGIETPVLISSSETSLPKEEYTFNMPPSLSHEIFHWQLVDSILYFNIPNLETNSIYQIDFTNDTIELFAKFDLYGKTGIAIDGNITFSILDPYMRIYHVYDGQNKNIYLMKGERNLSFMQISNDINYCNFSRTGNYFYSKGSAFYLSAACHLSPSDKLFYKKATNIIKIDTSDIKATESFIHFPEEYSHGIYPINSITNNSFLIDGNYLYFNFSISPFIYKYSLEDLSKRPEKVQVKSSFIKKYDILPTEWIDNSMSEMIHHYMQGFYAKLLISEPDPSYFVRIACHLDKKFFSEEHPTQQSLLLSLMKSVQYSMILNDRKGKSIEILLNEDFDPNTAFIRDNQIFYSVVSNLQSDDQIKFASIDLAPLLERLFINE